MRALIILIIKAYQYTLSPLFPQACRFIPTCSVYSIDALRKYGAVKGTYLAVRRILRCNPWNPGGFDPVR
jgi:hypothetical protein